MELFIELPKIRLGTIWALIISSLIFGFRHVANANFNIFSGLAIALELGLLTGIYFTLTQRLWVPIALHIGWNFSLIFWGTIVSGASTFPNFIDSVLDGSRINNGWKIWSGKFYNNHFIQFDTIYNYIHKNV